jgi:hypothetical protein
LLATELKEECEMKQLLLTLVACAALVGVSRAEAIFTFSDIGNSGGTASYNGTTSTVSGMGTLFLTVTGAPANNGTYMIDGPSTCLGIFPCGTTNTTTGAQTGVTSGTIIDFGSGGSLTLFGSLETLGGGVILPDQFLISSGSYASSTLDTTTGILTVLAGTGTDTKSAALASFFGITTTNFGFDLGVGIGLPPGYKCCSTFTNAPVLSGHIDNTVSEPAGLALLGAGLLALGTIVRRRLSRV